MSSTEKPTKETFAQIMLAAIRKHETTPLRYDPEEFRLIEEGDRHSLWLANAYREYCDASSPADAERTLERYCSVWHARRAPKQPGSPTSCRTSAPAFVSAPITS